MPAPAFPVEAVTAAILAGGEGSRVGGRDKGLMPLAGRPLIAWVCEAIGRQCGAILISANRNVEQYAAFGRVVADAGNGFAGPLAGIAAALNACTTPWLLTVPVDSPRPPHDLGVRLHAAIGDAAAAVAVQTSGTREPLFALYRRALAGSACTAAENALGVWAWQDICGAIEVEFAEVEAFANLNTDDDFRRWEANADD